MLKKEEASTPQWFILDATGKTLGRFASEVAKILRGKHKPNYTPYEIAAMASSSSMPEKSR